MRTNHQRPQHNNPAARLRAMTFTAATKAGFVSTGQPPPPLELGTYPRLAQVSGNGGLPPQD